ncbi:copper resistance system multicopper oxidase [Parvibaculum sedimenti]|uniref:Copper resistance system multicopper oxidase n=1 Tax=Parvibaculum sedimenti TaxID=2608632 RepID=A0A6N6VKU7_9HYPH|nr:copper resistance system multicopper oxidase [Parvibaculum sedimenti]KAB7742130.1 copper resistance system multicopper oxidase [Parvibaculum sedimenti]
MRVSLLVFTFIGLAFASFAAKAGEYSLVIDRHDVDIGGRHGDMIIVNGQFPGPLLRFREGEDVAIHVTNRLKDDSSVHWHGLLLPGEMDGVPGMNGFGGIAPGATFTYHFKVRQSGTYWYHSHSGLQEQEGLAGPIVIDPAKPSGIQAAHDYVVMLSDFTDERADDIFRNLKADSGYYNHSKRTAGDFFRGMGKDGIGATLRDRLDWGEMRMDPTDLADVTGYTFLVNGKSASANWTGLFKPGERIRLRFINASAMTYFDLRIPGLKMIVVAADGQNVMPVPVDEIRLAIAETYDVIVTPKDGKAYTIFAQSLDRSGYARATLAPREGMEAPVPPLRRRAQLTMADMGMGSMEGMDHGSMSNMDMGGMDMSQMGHAATNTKPKESKSPAEEEQAPKGWGAGFPAGEKVLSYGDLKSLTPQKDLREPSREIIVHLTGNMERYIWTLNGKKFGDAQPIELKYGERVKLTFVNDTMMAHPMHLHGMFVQLVNGQPAARLPNKHIVSVPPGQSYSVLLTADAPGEWAFHCHLLYHMASGMMNKVVVARMSAEAAR